MTDYPAVTAQSQQLRLLESTFSPLPFDELTVATQSKESWPDSETPLSLAAYVKQPLGQYILFVWCGGPLWVWERRG